MVDVPLGRSEPAPRTSRRQLSPHNKADRVEAQFIASVWTPTAPKSSVRRAPGPSAWEPSPGIGRHRGVIEALATLSPDIPVGAGVLFVGSVFSQDGAIGLLSWRAIVLRGWCERGGGGEGHGTVPERSGDGADPRGWHHLQRRGCRLRDVRRRGRKG